MQQQMLLTGTASTILHTGTFTTVGQDASTQLKGYATASFGAYSNTSGSNITNFYHAVSPNLTVVFFSGGDITSSNPINIVLNGVVQTFTWNAGNSRYQISGDPFGLQAAYPSSPNWPCTAYV